MKNYAECRNNDEAFKCKMEMQSPSWDVIRNRKLEFEVACQKSKEQAKKGGIEVAEMRDSQAQVGQRNIS